MFDDKAMICDSYKWPMWPFLPVKRKNSQLEDKNLGFLVSDIAPFVIYHMYVFDLPKDKKKWDDSEKTTYQTADEMLADGWIVD